MAHKTISKHFRFTETDEKALSTITKIENEKGKALCEKYNIPCSSSDWNNSEMIRLLIYREFKRLKEEGYDVPDDIDV